MEEAKLQLLLGCYGYQEDGFVSCKGCENCILTVDSSLDRFKEMMDYFDSCRLFDKKMYEYNSINGFIRNMQAKFDHVTKGRTLWSEKNYRIYQKFISDHRLCGIYIQLVPFDNNKMELNIVEEKSIPIKTHVIEPTIKTEPKNLTIRFRGQK